LTKLHNNELPSVKAADLVNYVVLAFSISKCVHVRTVRIAPFNYWSRVKCGLRICATYNW